MGLPPLELFSLRRELPIAGRLFPCLERNSALVWRFLVPAPSRFGPLRVALFASPRVLRVHAFEHRIAGATIWTDRQFILRHFAFELINDLLWDRVCGNCARPIELIGGDKDAR